MNKLQTKYFQFLEDRVQLEINFLVDHWHENEERRVRCPFCRTGDDGRYYCNRLTDLRNFMRYIYDQKAKILQKDVNRRKIGQMAHSEQVAANQDRNRIEFTDTLEINLNSL